MVDVTKLPIKLPKIDIDYSRCTVPMWCKKCLQVCPQLVFSVYCKQMVRGKESDPREPGVYELLPQRRDKCNMCNKCVEICPEGAITITYNGKMLEGAKKYDTVEEAKKSPYNLWEAPRPYSFELNEEMIDLLRHEFDPRKIVDKFAQAITSKEKKDIDNTAEGIFSEYGKEWMKKVLQLGEDYPDRTYEVIKEVIDRVGELFFPLVPQRFIEIAYLSTQQFLKLTVLENYRHRLVYQVPNCYTFKQLKGQSDASVCELMPCKYACLTGLDTLFRDLDLDVIIEMDAETAKDSYCQFRITCV